MRHLWSGRHRFSWDTLLDLNVVCFVTIWQAFNSGKNRLACIESAAGLAEKTLSPRLDTSTQKGSSVNFFMLNINTILLLYAFCLVITSSNASSNSSPRLIHQFPNGTRVENIAVRPNGRLLLTFITHPDSMATICGVGCCKEI
jgi:hypothetical protein